MLLGARGANARLRTSTSALVSKLKTPVAQYSRTVVVKNRRLIRGSAASSETDSSPEPKTGDDQIQQTLAGLDALLGIEAEPEEVEEKKPEVCGYSVIKNLFLPHPQLICGHQHNHHHRLHFLSHNVLL